MTATMTTSAERVLTVHEVADHFGSAPGTIYSLIARGDIRAIRVGRLLRVPESALQEFIDGGHGTDAA